MADFLMPALGADMETGELVQWLVQPGSRVRRGDVVAVVETHKGAIDVEIFQDGVIDELVPIGTRLPIGGVLARVRGQDAPAATAPAAAAPAAASPVRAAASPAQAGAPSAQAGALPTQAAATPPPSQPRLASPSAGERVRASPAARRLAGRQGLDLAALRGTGVGGAVTLADVERAGATARTAADSTGASTAPAPRRGFDPVQMRLAIATAMSRSKREIPHYYVATTIDFQAAATWLATWNAELPPQERLLPAVLLLKATARALAARPAMNGFFVDTRFQPAPGVHLGWAIALRGGGLVAPAIHDADKQSLPQLMAALRDLVARARSGGLRSSEMSDPTATVTSLGERGADSVLGVIYPPQVAMVGFGCVADRPWVVDGQVAARPLVNASLAADHRASDGHVGSLLLSDIGAALQSPETL